MYSTELIKRAGDKESKISSFEGQRRLIFGMPFRLPFVQNKTKGFLDSCSPIGVTLDTVTAVENGPRGLNILGISQKEEFIKFSPCDFC